MNYCSQGSFNSRRRLRSIVAMFVLAASATALGATLNPSSASAEGCVGLVYQPYKVDQLHATTRFTAQNCSGISYNELEVKLYRNGTPVSSGTTYSSAAPAIDRRYNDGCWNFTASYKGWSRMTSYALSGHKYVTAGFGDPRYLDCSPLGTPTVFSSLSALVDDGTPVAYWNGN